MIEEETPNPIVSGGEASKKRGGFSLKKLSHLNVAIFALIIGLIGGYFTFKSFAAQATIASIEAESMKLPSYTKVISDGSSSGGKAIDMQKNGTATASLTLPSAATSVNVTAKGTQCNGYYPVLYLVINGKTVMQPVVTSTKWHTYSIATNQTAGIKSISVIFKNNWYSSKCIRHLYVDTISFIGNVASSPVPTPPSYPPAPPPTSPNPDSSCTSAISSGASVNAALSTLKPGNVLCLHGGTYSGNVSATVMPASTTSPITVKAYPGERPIIQGLFWITGASNWTFDGINVTWPPTGASASDHMVKMTNGVGWTWKNSEIWGAHSYADMLVAGTTSGQPSNWQITNNCIHDTSPSNDTNQDHNLYVNTGVSAGAGLISHNIFYNATNGENVKLAGANNSQGTVNVTVDHNTMYNAAQNILIGGASGNNSITNNVFGLTGPTYGNVRGFNLTGTNNVAKSNVGYQAKSLILNYTGGNGVSDGGNNLFPVDPQFDTTMCSITNGVLKGFRPQNATIQKYGAYGA